MASVGRAGGRRPWLPLLAAALLLLLAACPELALARNKHVRTVQHAPEA